MKDRENYLFFYSDIENNELNVKFGTDFNGLGVPYINGMRWSQCFKISDARYKTHRQEYPDSRLVYVGSIYELVFKK